MSKLVDAHRALLSSNRQNRALLQLAVLLTLMVLPLGPYVQAVHQPQNANPAADPGLMKTADSATASWSQLSPSASPAARFTATFSIVYDPVDNYVVLFGGDNSTGFLSDTWSFVGGQWTKLSPKTSPPARAEATMVYDPVDGYVLLFGGLGVNGKLSDTWSFVGGQWTKLSPKTSPPARTEATMAYDSADGYVLLFGGLGAGFLSDTWTFTRGQWVQIFPIVSPSTRRGATMVYDSADGYVLLFGGIGTGTTDVMNDTWTFAQGNWMELSSTPAPPARRGASMAYDSADGYVVLFGGVESDGGYLSGTWTFYGGLWTQISPAVSAPPRRDASMAYDSADGYIILFGGRNSASEYLRDTWQFLQVLQSVTDTILSSSTMATSTTDSTSTTMTFSTIIGSTTLPSTTITTSPTPTWTTAVTNTVTGPVTGASTSVYLTASTSLSTSFMTIPAGETTAETGATTGTSTSSSTTSTRTAFSTTTANGTITVSETDTFYLFLTHTIQQLHELADEILQLFGSQPVATPGTEEVTSVQVTVLPATTTTTLVSSTMTTSTTSSLNMSSTFSTVTGSTTFSPTTGDLVLDGTTSTTSTVGGSVAGTSTTTYTSTLSTSTMTSVTTSASETTLQTGVTTVSTGLSMRTTSTGTAFTSTTSGGTVTVTETDTFDVLLSTIFRELHQLADEFLQLIGIQPIVTPVGEQVNRVIVTTATSTVPTVTMTVSFLVVGGGSPTPPVFNYVHGGVEKSLTLTSTPVAVSVDVESAWSVTPNPLTGSGASQRWSSTQPLTGTASTTTIQFVFQHQFYLTVHVNPTGEGSVTPKSGWINAGQTVTLTATPNAGHKFKSWSGYGTGNYTGTGNPAAITINSAITETANFT